MTNKEFLFIYDAALSNPNGDPDAENKPRMDRATKTNLVSDTRLKRTIRDYLISKFDADPTTENDVFVRMMGENKVSVEKRLMGIVSSYLEDKAKLDKLKTKFKDLQIAFENLRAFKDKDSSASSTKDSSSGGKKKTEPFKGDDFELYHSYVKKDQELISAISKVKELGEVNNELLTAIVKDTMIDSRFFGGAFAVGGFSKTVIGSIQVNTGYSLHPVELNPSNSIVTIMGDKEGQSGIGKKETLFYSLISHTGTINAKRGAIVNLSENDLKQFREAIILSILDWRTDSKKNQYPRLYLEIDYKENEIYGRLGDLRNLVDVTATVKENSPTDFSEVRSIKDVNIDFSELSVGLEKIKDKVEKIRIWTSLDGSCDSLITLLKEKFEEGTIEQLTI
jgi:CRISPR-associated protein Csh2